MTVTPLILTPAPMERLAWPRRMLTWYMSRSRFTLCPPIIVTYADLTVTRSQRLGRSPSPWIQLSPNAPCS